MARHLRITVEGKVYDVIVEEVEEESLPTPHRYPHITSRSGVAPAASQALPFPSAQPSAEQTPPGGAVAERAPLRGLILEVAVRVGERVSAGDKIVVIEAMKMKSTIRAHGDGVVINVAVNVGDVVDSGQSLLTIG